MLELDFTPPPGWWPAEQTATVKAWSSRQNDRVRLEFHPYPVSAEPEALETYRHDLRLVAATRGGGLIECEMDSRLGVTGVIKYPGPSGSMVYQALALCPVAGGHVEVLVTTLEAFTSSTRAELLAGQVPAGKPADPYGFVYPRPSFFERFKKWWTFPKDLLLALPADSADYDEQCPTHPLSRARQTLRQFQPALSLKPTTTGGWYSGAFMMWIPIGFSTTKTSPFDLKPCFLRQSFEQQRHFLAAYLTDHPGRRLKTLGKVTYGPHTGPGGLQMAELLAEQSEWVGVSGQRPWGGETLEVVAVVPRPNRARTVQLVEQTLASVK